tara:strand:+ start:628 stop:858 length:231 start_codon:yes stop_codon:yes gene_type:complete
MNTIHVTADELFCIEQEAEATTSRVVDSEIILLDQILNGSDVYELVWLSHDNHLLLLTPTMIHERIRMSTIKRIKR